MGQTKRPELYALADRAGIVTHWASGDGPPNTPSAETLEGLLAALGIEVSSEDECARARTRLDERDAATPPPDESGARPPGRCTSPEDLLGESQRAFGILTHLYTLRGTRPSAIGDFGHLRELVQHAAPGGADFVGLSPLHAMRNRGVDISPYRPLSRCFGNPAYLEMQAVPAWAEGIEARAIAGSEAFSRELAALDRRDLIDHERALALKLPVLEALYRAGPGSAPLPAAPEGDDDLLTDFATFQVLEECYGTQRSQWPEGLASRAGTGLPAFRAAHGERIAFHRWLQREFDRQLEGAASEARSAGLGLGLYLDLALGCSPDGADPWLFPEGFARGATLGAPPDAYSRDGQDWELPPLDPGRLLACDFAPWRAALDATFRHAGIVRIDHVLGCERQWWIPAGASPRDGAYVRQPRTALLDIVAETSRRHRTIVVGEDLGSVPEGFGAHLKAHGLLSSKVLYFEQGSHGEFRPPAEYAREALVTANTHDLPTLRAYVGGHDLSLRHTLGCLDDADHHRAQGERDDAVRSLLDLLRTEGLIEATEGTPDGPTLSSAVHALLGRTACVLAGANLDDLAGEQEPLNVPGLDLSRYPSWSRRMALTLEQIFQAPSAVESIDRLRAPRGRRSPSRAREKHQVFLVPGFFGFDQLGDLRYFDHVQRYLEAAFQRAGLDAVVHPTTTVPTASIRKRAGKLLESIAAIADEGGPIHLIGHSTGGLDARLLVTPQVSLGGSPDVEGWARRVRSVVSVATPHRGAPIASFFASAFGQPLLGTLSYLSVQMLRTGHLPARTLAFLARASVRFDDHMGGSSDLLDELSARMLADFTPERRAAVRRFLDEVRNDQTLLTQLTPQALDLFNAAAGNRPGLRYGSVVTRARRPGVGSIVRTGTSPAAQTSHTLFAALHRIAGRDPRWLAPLPAERERTLEEGFGDALPVGANDGIVPTRSQPWGSILATAWADHLDVIGHFHGDDLDPPHYDWLASGTGFRRADFERVWGRVFAFLLETDAP